MASHCLFSPASSDARVLARLQASLYGGCRGLLRLRFDSALKSAAFVGPLVVAVYVAAVALFTRNDRLLVAAL